MAKEDTIIRAILASLAAGAAALGRIPPKLVSEALAETQPTIDRTLKPDTPTSVSPSFPSDSIPPGISPHPVIDRNRPLPAHWLESVPLPEEEVSRLSLLWGSSTLEPYARTVHPFFGLGDESLLVPATIVIEREGERIKGNAYVLQSPNLANVETTANVSIACLYTGRNLSNLTEQTEIDCAAMQRENDQALVDHIAALYNAYFPQPSREDEWRSFSLIWLEAFVEPARWVLEVAAGGVIGNFVYDKLKQGFKKKRDAVLPERQEYFQKTENDLDKIRSIVEEAKQQDRGIHVEEIAGRVGIEDRERAKAWLRLLGGRHAHAGASCCTYWFSRATS